MRGRMVLTLTRVLVAASHDPRPPGVVGPIIVVPIDQTADAAVTSRPVAAGGAARTEAPDRRSPSGFALPLAPDRN